MSQPLCPRCGERSGDGLCGPCAAYVLRFDPFSVRPGIPGPPVDREVRRGAILLSLSPSSPLRFADPRPRRMDEAYAIQYLSHVRLPDGGAAVLTRGDRAVLQRLLRTWARAPPRTTVARAALASLYAEVASLPGLPPAAAEHFHSSAATSKGSAREDDLEPETEPLPEPVPGPDVEPEPPPGPPDESKSGSVPPEPSVERELAELPAP
ncbi:MAG TPA: hypothetical protein VJ400_00755, partial [Thermoplasmata archaeon]|nr:hypothetical protein [Thermoplasmata archaeon]